MKSLLKCLPIILLLLLSSCGTTYKESYRPPSVTQAYDRELSVVLEAPYAAVWRALVDYVTTTRVSIEAYDRKSGLMTIAFGEADPERYVDCGRWDTHRSSFAAFMTGSAGFDASVLKFLSNKSHFSGKMRVHVQEKGTAATRLDVSSEYHLEVEPGRYPYRPGATWSFVTGGSATVPEGDYVPSVICRPTHASEQELIDSIQSRLRAHGHLGSSNPAQTAALQPGDGERVWPLAVGSQRREENRTPDGIAEAEKLVAEWKPGSCELKRAGIRKETNSRTPLRLAADPQDT